VSAPAQSWSIQPGQSHSEVGGNSRRCWPFEKKRICGTLHDELRETFWLVSILAGFRSCWPRPDRRSSSTSLHQQRTGPSPAPAPALSPLRPRFLMSERLANASICVTPEQFKAMVAASGLAGQAATGSAPPTSNDNTRPLPSHISNRNRSDIHRPIVRSHPRAHCRTRLVSTPHLKCVSSSFKIRVLPIQLGALSVYDPEPINFLLLKRSRR